MTHLAPVTSLYPIDPGAESQPDQRDFRIATPSSVTTVLVIFCTISTIFFGVLAYKNWTWELGVVAAFMAIPAILSIKSLISILASANQEHDLRIITGFLALVFIVMSALIQGSALPLGIIFLVYNILLTSAINFSTTAATKSIAYGLIVSTITVLIGTFPPFIQAVLPEINIWIITALSITLIFFIAFLAVEYETSTLQTRLTTAFISIVIIPIFISSLILTQTTISSVRSEIIQNVQLTSQQTSKGVDSFFDSNLKVVAEEAASAAFAKYLDTPGTMAADEVLVQEITMTLRVLQMRETPERINLSSYGLLNSKGVDVYDTDDRLVHLNESTQDYFKIPFESGKAYASQILFNDDGVSYIYFSAPVKSLRSKTTIGVLRVRYSGLVFQRILQNYQGLLGPESYPIMFDENLFRLADTFTPEQVFTSIVNYPTTERAALIETQRVPNLPPVALTISQAALAEALTASDKTPTGQLELDTAKTGGQDNLGEIFGISRVNNRPWKVLYIQANFDDAKLRNDQIKVTILIATLISLIVGFIAIFASAALGEPINRLIVVAQKITQGDLTARSNFVGNNEFGTLGNAFNQMADQLRNFINDLEQRVTQRTEELAHRNDDLTFRSRQLQTVSEVARGIVTVQDISTLLDSVTRLISERFNFYHVGIFLLDENKEYAVLRAANSEGGKRMLAREHRLMVGRVGIVGNVCSSGKPRIATDVGADSSFFNNPDLPLTRSEMALPLKFGGQVIGALDVQSTMANVFTEEDIELFITLTDQVAVAIYNNQLYTETLRALSESQSVHRQYLRQEWGSELAGKKNRAYRFTSKGISPSDVKVKEMDDIYKTGKPYITTETLPDNTIQSIMAVPITLRGETIGIIRLQDQGIDRDWSDDEITSVQDVAQQVGVALETARLFQKTILRADREKKVLEITGMIRATNDPQEMLKIAADELRKALGASRAQIILKNDAGDKSNDNGHNSGNQQQGKAP